MKAVLQANYMVNGVVTPGVADKSFIQQYTEELDEICDQLRILNLSVFCDFTDMFYNLGKELGIDKTTHPELDHFVGQAMVHSGTWVDARIAQNVLESLYSELNKSNAFLFSIPREVCCEIRRELKDSLEFAMEAVRKGGQFNFSVVV